MKRFKKLKFRKVHRNYRGISSQKCSRKHQAKTSQELFPVNSSQSAPKIFIYRSEGRRTGMGFYMWANRRERRHKNWTPMPGAVNKPTILRWYGARISRNENCCLCSGQDMKLDEGDDMLDNCDIEIEDNDLTDITIE